MPDIRTKTFTYKKVEFIPRAYAGSLSTLVAAAVASLNRIGQRRQGTTPGDDAPEWLVIGEYEGNADQFSGVLMRYSPGTAAATLIDDTEASIVRVETFVAPLEGEQRREFIDGSLYFTIMGNHVVVMQSAAVRDRTLEHHLQWLLRAARLIPEDHTFNLVNRPARAARELLERSNVRSIELDGDLLSGPLPAPRQDSQAAEAAASASVPAQVWQAMMQLLPPGDRHRLETAALDASRLSYVLQVKFGGRRSSSANDTLDRIGRAMRNADGVKTVITLDSGEQIEDNLLRVSGKVRVETRHGVPAPGHVFSLMRDWLVERLANLDA